MIAAVVCNGCDTISAAVAGNEVDAINAAAAAAVLDDCEGCGCGGFGGSGAVPVADGLFCAAAASVWYPSTMKSSAKLALLALGASALGAMLPLTPGLMRRLSSMKRGLIPLPRPGPPDDSKPPAPQPGPFMPSRTGVGSLSEGVLRAAGIHPAAMLIFTVGVSSAPDVVAALLLVAVDLSMAEVW